MKPKPTSHRATNTFKFKGFLEKLKDIRINSRKYIISKLETEDESETLLVQTIRKWSNLNLSQGFQDFQSALGNEIQTISQLLLKQTHITETFKFHLENADSLSLSPILHCLVGFARDIPDEFYNNYFYTFFPILINAASSNTKSHEIIENVFVCMVSLFTLERKYLESDFDASYKKGESKNDFYRFYVETDFCMLFSKRVPWYVGELSAQTLGNLIRNFSPKIKRKVFVVCLNRLSENEKEIEGVGRLMFNSIKLDVTRRLHSNSSTTLSLLIDLIISEQVQQDGSTEAVVFCLHQLAFHVTAANIDIKTHWQESWKEDSDKIWPVLYDKLTEVCNSYDSSQDYSLLSILKFIYKLVQFKHSALVTDFDKLLNLLNTVSLMQISDEVGRQISEIISKIVVSSYYENTTDALEKFLSSYLMSTLTPTVKFEFIGLVKESPYFESHVLEVYYKFVLLLLSDNEDDVKIEQSILDSLANIINSKIVVVRTAVELESWTEYSLDFDDKLKLESNIQVKKTPGKILESVLEKGLLPDLSNLEWIAQCCLILPHIQSLEREEFVPNLFWIMNDALELVQKTTVPLIADGCESKRKKRKLESESSVNFNFNVNLESNEISRKLIFLISVIVETLSHLLSPEDFLPSFSGNELIHLIKNSERYRENVHLLKAVDIYLTLLQKEEDEIILNEATLKDLFTVLAPSLSSPKPLVRQLVSHIFSLFHLSNGESEENSLFVIMHQVESSSLSPLDFKERLRLLSKLSAERLNFDSPQLRPFDQAPLLFLIGQLFINFNQIWPTVKDLIAKWANSMNEEVFWEVWLAEMKLAAHFTMRRLCDKELEDESTTYFENTSIADFHSSLLSHPGFGHLNVNPDYFNFRDLLWQCMQQFPNICEKKNKDVVSAFLDFLNYEFFTADHDIAPTQDISPTTVNEDDDEEVEDGEKEVNYYLNITNETEELDTIDIISEANKTLDETELMEPGQRVRKAPTKSLCEHLTLFAKFHNPKVIYKSKELEEIYCKFLTHPYSKAQKLALDCILSYSHKFLTPYRESLYNMLNDKSFRSEITLFDIEGSSEDNTKSLREEHRSQFMPYLMRIMYGKMLSKPSNRMSGAMSRANRRAIVLRFLAGATEPELDTFLNLNFDFIVGNLEGNALDVIQRVQCSIDPKKVVPLPRLQASLGTLDDIMDKLSYLIDSKRPFLLKVILFILMTSGSLLEKREQVSPHFYSQLKNIRQMAMKMLLMFFSNFLEHKWADEEIEAVFQSAVWPSLTRLPDEGIYTPTQMFQLFIWWSQNPSYHILLSRHAKEDKSLTPMPYVIKLLHHPKCSNVVKNAVFDVIEHLLGRTSKEEDEDDAEEDEERLTPEELFPSPLSCILPIEDQIGNHGSSELSYGESIVFYCMEEILAYIKDSLSGFRSGRMVKKSNLNILTHLAKWISNEKEALQIMDSIVPILKKCWKQQDKLSHLFEICGNLLKITNTKKYTNDFLCMFSLFDSRDARISLCNVIKVICSKVGRDETLSNWASGLNAWKESTLDDIDSEMRIRCYRTIKEYLATTDKLDRENIVFLIHQNIWVITHSGDQSLCTLSVLCMEQLFDAIIRINNFNLIKKIFDQQLLPLLKLGLKNKSEGVRDCVVAILGHAVRKCHSIHPRLKDLHILSNATDIDADFFADMSHLQRSKRSRALFKLAENLKEGIYDFQIDSLIDFILSIVTVYLFKEEYASDSYLLDCCVTCLGAIAMKLPWNHYQNLLKHYLSLMSREVTQLKLGVRVLEVIIDSFHEEIKEFDPREIIETPKKVMNVSTLSDNDNDVEMESEFSQWENHAFSEINSKDWKAKNVYFSLTRDFIPQIEKTLAKRSARDIEHKLNKKKYAEDEDIKRIPLALALVKLLKKLPSKLLHYKINGVLMKLIIYLKSRADSIRRESRNMIVKVMQELGGEYFSYLVKDMTSILDKGYQTHVLVFTLHSIIIALQDKLSSNDVARCIKDIMKICMGDLFGEKAAEKEVNQLRVKVKEMRSEKGYSIMGILSQAVHVEDVEDLIKPLKEKLRTHDKKVVNKIIICLQKIGNGLERNTNITVEHKSILVYGLLQDKIKELSFGKENNYDKEAQKSTRRDCFLLEPEPKKMGFVPKTNAKTTSHALVEFALNLLYILLKQGHIVPTDKQHCGLLDPYVPMMSDCLLSEYPETSIQALHVISCLIKFPLPSLKKYMAKICGQMFVILNKFASASLIKGKLFELVQLDFKVLALIIKEVKYYVIEANHFQILLCYAKNNLEDYNLHHSSFTILNALIERKVNDSNMHGLMIIIRDLSVKSNNMNMLDQARCTYLRYILNFPKKKRFAEVLMFYLWNISYCVPAGRMSALMMMNDLVHKLDRTLFTQDVEVTVWLKVTIQLIVEKEKEHKTLIKKILKNLFKKSSRKNLLVGKCIELLRDDPSKNKSENALASHMGSQSLMSMLGSELGEHSSTVFDSLMPILEVLLHPGRYTLIEEKQEIEINSQTQCFDMALISILELLIKLLDVYITKDRAKFMNSIKGDLWKYSQDHLLYPNLQVRLNSALIFGKLFAAYPLENDDIAPIASSPKMVQSLVLNFCEQLNTECPIESNMLPQLGLAVVRNLIYLIRQTNKVQIKPYKGGKVVKTRDIQTEIDDNVVIPEIDFMINETEKEKPVVSSALISAAYWVLQRVGVMAYTELREKRKKYTFIRECFLNLIAGIIVIMGDEFPTADVIVSFMLRHLTRESYDKKLPEVLKTRTQEVARLVREKIGAQRYTEEVMIVQESLEKKRNDRKARTKELIVTNPQLALRKKAAKNEAKKVSKKRKFAELKLKPSRKKLRRMAMVPM